MRIRDPKTGKKLNNKNESDYKSIKPVHFDYKGNYGVAINWSDGYYEDIFPYEVLKIIAEENSWYLYIIDTINKIYYNIFILQQVFLYLLLFLGRFQPEMENISILWLSKYDGQDNI